MADCARPVAASRSQHAPWSPPRLRRRGGPSTQRRLASCRPDPEARRPWVDARRRERTACSGPTVPCTLQTARRGDEQVSRGTNLSRPAQGSSRQPHARAARWRMPIQRVLRTRIEPAVPRGRGAPGGSPGTTYVVAEVLRDRYARIRALRSHPQEPLRQTGSGCWPLSRSTRGVTATGRQVHAGEERRGAPPSHNGFPIARCSRPEMLHVKRARLAPLGLTTAQGALRRMKPAHRRLRSARDDPGSFRPRNPPRSPERRCTGPIAGCPARCCGGRRGVAGNRRLRGWCVEPCGVVSA